MKVVFITAIYGAYEASCKPIIKQTIDVDQICFSNIKDIKLNGWKLDLTEYHNEYPVDIDSDITLRNSLINNPHTYNVGKYYKFQWHLIPILKHYDVVIWLDGTVEIINPKCAEMLVERTLKYGICTWNHERHAGILKNEINACSIDKRFNTTNWFGQNQPLQPVSEQYNNYIENGYSEEFWKTYPRKEGRGDVRNFGVWLTCMLAYDAKNQKVIDFNNKVYYEMKKWTTMCQIAFPKVIQDTGLVPYTLPDNEIVGTNPHYNSNIHIKHRHGN